MALSIGLHRSKRPIVTELSRYWRTTKKPARARTHGTLFSLTVAVGIETNSTILRDTILFSFRGSDISAHRGRISTEIPAALQDAEIFPRPTVGRQWRRSFRWIDGFALLDSAAEIIIENSKLAFQSCFNDLHIVERNL
ncbi:MAG: hypothetical protein EXR02_09540 [Rhodospirillales bacterium]|nr:hypothetical protein [Rhodospirillales bacterium]